MLDQITFNIYVPEYANLSAPAFAVWLAVAADFTSGPLWVVQQDYATAQMLGHILKMKDKADTDGGALASEHIGTFAQSFNHGNMSDGDLALTSYGKEFLRVRSLQPRLGFVSH